MSVVLLAALIALVGVAVAGVGGLFAVVFVAGRSGGKAQAQVRDSHQQRAA
ncbi:hypothetical protein GCM10022237_47260 [Nocardioides ginsengisoli]|uniref:Uncharacterized protein n=1 Tax=Nocardioides ginsengisoli TaxID=363868 RepID=A0ABW3W2I1_9ACTN